MSRPAVRIFCAILTTMLAAVPATVSAAEALIAVAANFAPVAATIKARFEAEQEHQIRIAAGSTGKLYAQIRNGAPFDIFLAADQQRPALLENEGVGIPGSRFTYAVGRLGIWVPTGMDLNAERMAATLSEVSRIAMANPALAPYGVAGQETLEHLGIHSKLAGRIAQGENVAQAYAMVASGAADAGLVAWSHIQSRGVETQSWLVPQDWHTAVRQDALLLQHGADNPAAAAFLVFLQSAEVRSLIAEQGYPDS